jgi:recombination associated protein RdgC
MIKAATIFTLQEPMTIVHQDLEPMAFLPTQPTQEKSRGWVPPSSDNDLLTRTNSGATIMKLRVETRTVPASAIHEYVEKAVEAIMQSTGRKPGRKERRELKEEAKTSLLPHAFPKQKDALCILDGDTLIVDSSSQSVVDDAITALVKCIEGFVALPLSTKGSPSTRMAQWLTTDESPDNFAIGRSLSLEAMDESKAKVKYDNHHLLTDEVKTQIAQGMWPMKLSLCHLDRVDFYVDHELRLSGIALDVVDESADTDESEFDGSMAIVIAEMRPLIQHLTEAFGGQA